MSLPTTTTPAVQSSRRGTTNRARRPRGRPGAHLPTRLRAADLLRITDRCGAEVLEGIHDPLLPAAWDPVNRWSARIHSDFDLDVWLISWTPGQTTRLHDHAGSLGALTVLSGALREYHWTGGDLAVRVLDAGDQAAFPLGWVHDVVAEPTNAAGPALSVHAYSPPLTAMSFYEITDEANLRRVGTELTDGPE